MLSSNPDAGGRWIRVQGEPLSNVINLHLELWSFHVVLFNQRSSCSRFNDIFMCAPQPLSGQRVRFIKSEARKSPCSVKINKLSSGTIRVAYSCMKRDDINCPLFSSHRPDCLKSQTSLWLLITFHCISEAFCKDSNANRDGNLLISKLNHVSWSFSMRYERWHRSTIDRSKFLNYDWFQT